MHDEREHRRLCANRCECAFSNFFTTRFVSNSVRVLKKYNVRFFATDAAIKQILKRAALVNSDCRNPGVDSFSSSITDLTVSFNERATALKYLKMFRFQWSEK